MSRRALSRVAAVAVVVAAQLAALPLVARPATAVTYTTHTPVMGANLLNADQLAAWYNFKRGGVPPRVPGVDNDIRALAQIFIEEGRREGLRGDIAFVQSILETGWFMFSDSGQIRPWFNNFAGIFAYDGRPKGTTCEAETPPSRCFPSARIGVRTQIHLLRGYADITSVNLPDRLLLPPSDRRGVAPIWEIFGGSSGKAIWATAPDYGLRIIQLYSAALVYNGAREECLPYTPGGADDLSGNGYWVVTANGVVQRFGTAGALGDLSKVRLNAPIVGSEATSGGKGYWLLGRDGGIFTFGTARFYGSTGAIRLNRPVIGMERTDTNSGYWLVATDGGIFTFGDARFYGSTGGIRLNQPVLGMERTKSGKGYWLFAADGGIFTFGDARFFGSLGARKLSAPVVAMQRTPTGLGYWMLGADGAVFPFGDARDYGDVAGCTNYGKSSRLLVTPTGKGYWTLTQNGTVIALGDARRLGFPPTVTATAVGFMLKP